MKNRHPVDKRLSLALYDMPNTNGTRSVQQNRHNIFDDVLIAELNNRLLFSGNQATHFIGQVTLFECHVEEQGSRVGADHDGR